MSVFDDVGARKPRAPSMRGVLMQDVSNGKERSRAWPQKRKKKLPQKTLDQMEWFRQAQWATKYMDPRFMTAAIEATADGPLLPRDILTMMFASRLCMFSTNDGRKVYPQVAYNDVSESLDVISQTPGDILIRANDQWIGQPLPSGGGFSFDWVYRASNSSSSASVRNLMDGGVVENSGLGMWDDLNSQFVIGPGVSSVLVDARCSINSATQTALVIVIDHTPDAGLGTTYTAGSQSLVAGSSSQLSSGPIPVQEGDIIGFRQQSGAARTLQGGAKNDCWVKLTSAN